MRQNLDVGALGKAFRIHQFFSPEECKYFLKQAEQAKYKDLSSEFPEKYRKGERVISFSKDLALAVYDRIRLFLAEADIIGVKPIGYGNDGKWIPFGVNECFKFVKNGPGSCFKQHRDAAWIPQEDVASIYTLLIFLNEPSGDGVHTSSGYEGGSTRFYYMKNGKPSITAVEASTGMALAFTPDMFHDGAKVLGGTRYFVRTEILCKLKDAHLTPMKKRNNYLEDPSWKETMEDYVLMPEKQQQGPQEFVDWFTSALDRQCRAGGSIDLKALQEHLEGMPFGAKTGKTKQNIANDIALNVLLPCLQPLELFVCLLVNKTWCKIARHGKLWAHHYQQRWPLRSDAIDPSLVDWFKHYCTRVLYEHDKTQARVNLSIVDVGLHAFFVSTLDAMHEPYEIQYYSALATWEASTCTPAHERVPDTERIIIGRRAGTAKQFWNAFQDLVGSMLALGINECLTKLEGTPSTRSFMSKRATVTEVAKTTMEMTSKEMKTWIETMNLRHMTPEMVQADAKAGCTQYRLIITEPTCLMPWSTKEKRELVLSLGVKRRIVSVAFIPRALVIALSTRYRSAIVVSWDSDLITVVPVWKAQIVEDAMEQVYCKTGIRRTNKDVEYEIQKLLETYDRMASHLIHSHNSLCSDKEDKKLFRGFLSTWIIVGHLAKCEYKSLLLKKLDTYKSSPPLLTQLKLKINVVTTSEHFLASGTRECLALYGNRRLLVHSQTIEDSRSFDWRLHYDFMYTQISRTWKYYDDSLWHLLPGHVQSQLNASFDKGESRCPILLPTQSSLIPKDVRQQDAHKQGAHKQGACKQDAHTMVHGHPHVALFSMMNLQSCGSSPRHVLLKFFDKELAERESFCRVISTHTKLPHQLLPRFETSELLYAMESKFSCSVIVADASRVFCISGDSASLIDGSFKHQIRFAQVKPIRGVDAKKIGDERIWQYLSENQGWITYSASSSAQMTSHMSLFPNGELVVVENGKNYKVDFASMCQISKSSGYIRPIRLLFIKQ